MEHACAAQRPVTVPGRVPSLSQRNSTLHRLIRCHPSNLSNNLRLLPENIPPCEGWNSVRKPPWTLPERGLSTRHTCDEGGPERWPCCGLAEIPRAKPGRAAVRRVRHEGKGAMPREGAFAGAQKWADSPGRGFAGAEKGRIVWTRGFPGRRRAGKFGRRVFRGGKGAESPARGISTPEKGRKVWMWHFLPRKSPGEF